ncbi:hypothetical protein N7495_000992 [Penicillium taxi]|uniref:uncharacterized protein n=1 Tax=Penicillium taxi TaxID=168475 RepID=UPI0025456895|nr:uncharacterized protein N7495_000992 [Penicillium taxi]KAJ5908310.1 hypothetical protein N7495_000992 [Penicillium taxi]
MDEAYNQWIPNFKCAKKEVQLLIDEVLTCQMLADIFSDTSSLLESRVMQLAYEKKLDKLLQSQTISAREQIDHIMKRLKPLLDGDNDSRLNQCIAKVWWHFTKDETQVALVILGSVKSSLTLLSSLLTLDSLVKILKSPTARKESQSLLLRM